MDSGYGPLFLASDKHIKVGSRFLATLYTSLFHLRWLGIRIKMLEERWVLGKNYPKYLVYKCWAEAFNFFTSIKYLFLFRYSQPQK